MISLLKSASSVETKQFGKISWIVGYSICLVKCYNCGHYYIDVDSEWVCNDHKKEVAKYLRLCNYSNRDCLGELPYISIKDDIKGLLVLPYSFICLSSIIANFPTKIKK